MNSYRILRKNAVHIKYIETPITNPGNINNTKNLLHINNTTNKISISDKLTTSEFINKFILVFNPLLNVYMFLINNNNYLSIDNEYYFKLIRKNQLSDKTNVFNIQSFKNNNLYINYKNNKISLGNETTAFSFVNFTPSKKEILNYNNCLNNNILFNNDTKIIYLKDSVEYFDVITNDEFRKNATKKKIKLKQVDNNKWELISIKDNNIKVSIENLINSSSSNKPNIYSFKTANGQNFINMEIGLYNNYNDLQIESYSYFKKLLSFNDINKILPNTNEYQGQIERANLYKNNELILDKIYLDDIIKISMGETILYGKENNSITLKTEVSTDSKIGKYFVEIALESDTPNLYKLWNIDYEKLIIYDENSGINNVSLSSKSIKYNDIDRKADLDVQSVFEKIQEGNKYSYKLYNTSSNIYINPTELLKPNFSVTKIHNYGKKPIDIYKNKPYIDYCYEICKTNNIITDKLIQAQTYNVDMRDKDSPIALFLNESSIKIINTIPNNDDYYAIDDAEINYMAQDELLLNDIKEHITLKKLFGIDTIDLTNKKNIEKINKAKIKIKIITIELLVNSTNKKFNFILFKNTSEVGKKRCVGRFESSYNKPDKFVPDIQKSIKIFYDLNNVNLDFSKESGKQKSFDLISYTEAPVIDEQNNTKYVSLKNMNINIIQNYKISLFHINNTVPTNTIVDADEDTSKINVRKVYSTCYWGDCTDFNKMSQVEKNNIIDNIKQYEQMRSFQMGGFLDRNMIRFIRKEYKTKKKYIHFSNASLSSAEKGYVSKNVNYYKNNTLNDILFKQNDILEIHKVFGSRGWSNSYNSFYHKSKFLINKITDITENDYYDSFRNIYPVTWIEKRFVNNAENLWKYDNWFADSPHFRSLPNFKFEEVQIIEKADEKTDLLPTIKLSGGNITINQKYMILIAVLILILIILYCGLF